jgi:uncharacterized protein (DUF1697 family)
MGAYIALLRGVNVGGHAVVRMEDLRRLFAAAGCADVCTYIQSGNVIFTIPDARAAAVQRKIRSRLRALLDAEVEIALRTAEEFARLARADPFGRRKLPRDAKRYVSFLCGAPREQPRFPLMLAREGLEAIGMRGGEVFVVSRKVGGRYGFPNAFVEKELDVAATTRNWTTVAKLAALASGAIGARP